MYKYILQSVSNINWLAIISLLAFFFVFLSSVVWALGSRKEHIDRMANLPLDRESGAGISVNS
jgi:cbb3-type cytochrome oxidase subunit 3